MAHALICATEAERAHHHDLLSGLCRPAGQGGLNMEIISPDSDNPFAPDTEILLLMASCVEGANHIDMLLRRWRDIQADKKIAEPGSRSVIFIRTLSADPVSPLHRAELKVEQAQISRLAVLYAPAIRVNALHCYGDAQDHLAQTISWLAGNRAVTGQILTVAA